MEVRVISYLEEYSRELRVEFDSLIDRSLNDGDMQAGIEATTIGEKIKDLRGIISKLIAGHKKHL